MFDFQNHLIFPTHAVAHAGPLPPSAERLSVPVPGGAVLHGTHIPADDLDPGKTLILGFGGNAWNGQDVAEYLHELYPGNDVVVFHYRGYSPSTGSPSAKALIEDAPLIYDAVLDGLKPDRVIAVGFSIGTAIAAQLSATRRLAGLILVTPFDSLKAVAQAMYPWLPIGPFFSEDIDAAGPLRDSRVPVAVVAAERDEIVPEERTEALRKIIPNLVYNRTIARSGHNDIYARSEFHDAMREALGKIVR
jgi:uncharacterized protein